MRSNKINILYLIDKMEIGGTEKQLLALIQGVDKNQFNPFLCTLRPSRYFFDEKELNIQKLELRFRGILRPNLPRLLHQLYLFCKCNQIHLIQAYFQDSAFIGSLVKAFLPVKLVGSFRDLGFWRTPVENLKMRLGYSFFNGFIANSQSVKTHFCTVDNIQPEKISVIYNGFKAGEKNIGEKKTKKNSGQYHVGIVGNCNRPVKRMQDFIKAAAFVSKIFQSAKFVVVGTGSQLACLKQLSEDLEVSEHIQFVGSVKDALPYIEEFDVGVNTSESEGFSNSVMEYMASGVPVVATDIGGNKELIENGVNGFLYPVGDYRQAAKHIARLLNDQSLRDSIGVRNKEKISTSFSYSKMIRSHEDYYRKLLDKQ